MQVCLNLEQIRAGLSSHCNRYQGGWIITDRVCLLRCQDGGPTAETWVVRRRLPGPAKEMHEAPEEAVGSINQSRSLIVIHDGSNSGIIAITSKRWYLAQDSLM